MFVFFIYDSFLDYFHFNKVDFRFSFLVFFFSLLFQIFVLVILRETSITSLYLTCFRLSVDCHNTWLISKYGSFSNSLFNFPWKPPLFFFLVFIVCLTELILILDFNNGQSFGCVQVEQSTVAVKELFGKFNDVLGPGCHCLPCCLGYKLAGTLSLRVQQLDVRCETKTKV